MRVCLKRFGVFGELLAAKFGATDEDYEEPDYLGVCGGESSRALRVRHVHAFSTRIQQSTER